MTEISPILNVIVIVHAVICGIKVSAVYISSHQPVGQVTSTQSVGPIDGAHLSGNNLVGHNSTAEPVGQ